MPQFPQLLSIVSVYQPLTYGIIILFACITLHVDCVYAASVLAYDQYGRLSEQLEMESTLRNKAENIATQVSLNHTIEQHDCTIVVGVGYVYS